MKSEKNTENSISYLSSVSIHRRQAAMPFLQGFDNIIQETAGTNSE